MLPPRMKRLKDALTAKGRRTHDQDEMLAELDEIDTGLEHLSSGHLGKRVKAGGSVMGPTPGACPTCGGPW
jgi:hypothetical protein